MIDLTKLKPHVVSRDLSGYITFIYGQYKTGKTSLAAQMPRPILIATEKGYNALPGVMAQDVTSWSDMRQVYRQLKRPEVKAMFDSVVIDTIDVASDMCQKYICNQNDIDSLSQLPYGQGWNKFKDEFNEVFRGLTQLGYAVYFIGHHKEIQVGDDNNKRLYVRSALSNSTREVIEGMADLTAYAHQKAANEMSVLTLRSPDDSVSCGSRFKYLPNEITLSYQNLIDAISKSIDKEAAEHDNKFVTDEKIDNSVKVKEYDFDDMQKEFQDIVGQLMTKDQGNARKITAIVDKYLGKGKKYSDCTPTQCEQMELVLLDLKDLIASK